MRSPCVSPLRIDLPDPDDRAVDRRVDVGAGRGADVERRGRTARGRPGAGTSAASRRRRRRPCARAASAALRSPACRPASERERAVGGAVVADRRHAALVDRQLQAQRADPRDHLRRRRAGRQQPRRRSPAARRATAGWSPPPNAVTSSIASATMAITTTTASWRRRASSVLTAAPEARGAPWGQGRRHREDRIGPPPALQPRVSQSRPDRAPRPRPSSANDQSQAGGRARASARCRIAVRSPA